ncbi:hypothetical protein BDQ17DRAFT_1414321 [Cyathus striatus]|nr:hypothetical protein BDQ17DRAFT_1414321 [Cyathus striatus]
MPITPIDQLMSNEFGDLLPSSIVRGSPGQKASQRRNKGYRKQSSTIAKKKKIKDQLSEQANDTACCSVLEFMYSKGLHLLNFLNFVSNPAKGQGRIRWHEFFVYPGAVKQILDWWVSPKNNSLTRGQVSSWTSSHVALRVSKEAEHITKSIINRELVSSFELLNYTKLLSNEWAPTTMSIISAFTTLPYAQKHKAQHCEKTDFMDKAGTLYQLSDSVRREACAIASTGLYGVVYDNINMGFLNAEQILGRHDTQENGTCATLFTLSGPANIEDLDTVQFQQSFLNAPPLSLSNILLNPVENAEFKENLVATILHIIVEHGGEPFHKFNVLHCLLLISNCGSLEEYLKTYSTWSLLVGHAHQIFDRFTRDAIKTNDPGRIVLVLKTFALSFRGTGRLKYAYEMLHFIHNITHIWPEGIRRIVLNNLILNPSGLPESGVETDLVQEHMNLLGKAKYKARGSNASWDWMFTIMPCTDALRQLQLHMNKTLGADIGSKHANARLAEDIRSLMDSLREHNVYCIQKGRTTDVDDLPVPNVVNIGLNHLSNLSKSPLADYNLAFQKLQKRRQMTAVTATGSDGTDGHSQRSHGTEALSTTSVQLPHGIDIAEDFLIGELMNLENEEDTLPLVSLQDVALDMDILEDDEVDSEIEEDLSSSDEL